MRLYSPVARRLWTFLFLAGCASVSGADERSAADRELTSQLAIELKSALTKALQVSPQSAIAVCNERAPAIAAKLAADHGVQIGRTALRVRNEANHPTAWQKDVLNDFMKRAAAGEPLASMEYSATVQRDGVTERRFMKAIGTEPLCLICHGQRLPPGLQQAIAAKYPADAATGFDVGDLRGAVYVVRRLPAQK